MKKLGQLFHAGIASIGNVIRNARVLGEAIDVQPVGSQ